MKRLIAALAICLLLSAQTPTIDATLFRVGFGLLKVQLQGQPPEMLVDTAYIAYRVDPPQSSAVPCPATGAWAADKQFFYVCIIVDPVAGTLRWRRTLLQGDW